MVVLLRGEEQEMAEPPDQTHQMFPKDMKWPEPTPLDTKAYTPEIKPVITIPEPPEVKDHTGSVQGFGAGESRTYQDVLTDLSEDDRLRLLKANGIDLTARGDKGFAAMRA